MDARDDDRSSERRCARRCARSAGRDDPVACRESETRCATRSGREHRGVGELDALRRPGRPGGVDQREDVIGAASHASAARRRTPRRPASRLVDGRGRGRRARARARRERAPRSSATRAPASPMTYRTWSRRRGERRSRTASRRASSTARSAMWNSGRLEQHQRDGVAALDRARCRRNPPASASDAVAQLRPRERDLVVLGADRDAVRMGVDGDPKGLGDGRRGETSAPPWSRPLPAEVAPR